MAYKVERLNCAGCGAPLSVGMRECPYGHPVNISTFNSVYDMEMPLVRGYASTYSRELKESPDDKDLNFTAGLCFLKLKLYDKALPAFEKAMEDNFDNSEAFFYGAVSVLKGKKPFVLLRPDIDKITEYINAALMIEPKGIYYYFLALIKYDYFARKFLNTKPSYTECLNDARRAGLSEYDIKQLYSVLGIDRPDRL